MVSISSTTSASSSTLAKASTSNAASLARLSSGNSITQSSDNVAALAIGTQLDTKVSALRSALGNAAQGSSLLQVASGSLDQQLDILERQKALATQASSGSLSTTDRSALNQEFQGLTQQLNSLAQGTNFNGVSLLDGSSASTSFSVGDTSSDTITVSLASTSSASLYGNQPTDIATQASAQAASATIDAAIQALTSAQANVGALDTQFGSATSDLTSALSVQSDASSQFLDTDISAESTKAAASKLQEQASIATQAQTNKLPEKLLRLVQ